MNDFNYRWGETTPGFIKIDYTFIERGRAQGFPLFMAYAMALDPRTKSMASFNNQLTSRIWEGVEAELMRIVETSFSKKRKSNAIEPIAASPSLAAGDI